MKGDREQAAIDALFGEVLRGGENPVRARAALAQAADETVLAAVLQRPVPVAFLEVAATISPWAERPRVLARIVLNPKTPRSLAQRLVSALYWRDLAEVAATPRIAAAVRSRAESQLRDGLADMRLGDSERQVTEAALQNARLREEDLVNALRREDVRAVLVETVAASSRWATSYAVKLALVLQPRTPLALALQRISSLVPRDLRRVAEDPALRPLVRAAASEVLDSNPRRLNEMP
jgi:hypothetical protein